eukprot:comp16621_c0_seq1/m.14793 comp16621_c0_seq1/g.14793  ORF comp16621_c0_seq1/g.14793 comp16621_c0_seq1/m.14793 type:complete len:381 (-) comp16621_c0_seq1:564-1706(-)
MEVYLPYPCAQEPVTSCYANVNITAPRKQSVDYVYGSIQTPFGSLGEVVVGQKGRSLRDYVRMVLENGRVSHVEYLLAIVYMNRLASALERSQGLDTSKFSFEVPSDLDLQTIFLACVMLATKYAKDTDRCYSNRVWAKFGETTLQRLNSAERLILVTIDYRLHLTEQQWEVWTDLYTGKRLRHSTTNTTGTTDTHGNISAPQKLVLVVFLRLVKSATRKPSTYSTVQQPSSPTVFTSQPAVSGWPTPTSITRGSPEYSGFSSPSGPQTFTMVPTPSEIPQGAWPLNTQVQNTCFVPTPPSMSVSGGLKRGYDAAFTYTYVSDQEYRAGFVNIVGPIRQHDMNSKRVKLEYEQMRENNNHGTVASFLIGAWEGTGMARRM